MGHRIAAFVAGCGLLSVGAQPVRAQKPVVNPGGIVNAATFAPLGQPGYGVNAGSLASVFGQNLASTRASATSFPLPTTLGGTSVSFGGIPAPLIYVSPTQINLQVPFATSPTFPDLLTPVVVTTATGASDPVDAHAVATAGIFTMDGSGCGRAAVFNVARDGSVSLNGPDNSVEPGGILTLYGTGLAHNAWPPLADGMPAPSDPPTRYYLWVAPILRGERYDIYNNHVLFLGAAPGFAGLDQYNVRLPDDAPEACSVPLQFDFGSIGMTQTIPISIHRGGGRCVDPPPDSLAVFRWTKTASSGINPPPPTDTLSIEFSSAIGKQASFPQPYTYRVPIVVTTPGPSCPGFEDRQLDAGFLFAQGPAVALGLLPNVVNGVPRYTTATLPGGAIQPGVYRIMSNGGADVGSFTTTMTIPAPIQITTDLSPGTAFLTGGTPVPGRDNKPLIVRWQGGEPNSVVIVEFSIPGGQPIQYSMPASEGEANPGPIGWAGGLEIVVTQTPDPTRLEHFQASGLTLGGWQVWSYEFRFGGLTGYVGCPCPPCDCRPGN
jgi:uncharacterized protein (TIGR03437 family)